MPSFVPLFFLTNKLNHDPIPTPERREMPAHAVGKAEVSVSLLAVCLAVCVGVWVEWVWLVEGAWLVDDERRDRPSGLYDNHFRYDAITV